MHDIFVRFILLTLLWIPIHTQALTVRNTAGKLSSRIESPAEVGQLKLTGTMNLADFEFIALEMPALKSLDLFLVNILEYNGEATFTGRTAAPAKTLPDYALTGLKAEEIILPQQLTAIGEGALAGTAIKQLALPASITTIGRHAFADCAQLTGISIPAAVSEIGEGTFKGCAKLESVDICGSPSAIAPYTFAGCTALKNFQLPESVKSIGTAAFNGCGALTEITFPESLKEIAERAFFGSGLTDVNLAPSTGLKVLGDWAFANCPSLISVELPASLTALGKGTFFNDFALAIDTLPEDITEIPDFTFAANAGSGTMLTDSNVERLGAYSLADWSEVSVLTLPESLDDLAEGAMADWQRLDTIKAFALTAVPGATPETWGKLNRQRVKLLVSEEMKDLFLAHPEWKEFKVMSPTDIAGVDAPTIDSASGNDVAVHVEGQTLVIASPHRITAVEFYDAAGRSYSFPLNRSGNDCRIDTSAWNSGVMIVRVMTDFPSTAVFKLSR